ncbi:hypothetical protein J7M28_00730 [bacterium]|nr:hypothetical protein [bacterium]
MTEHQRNQQTQCRSTHTAPEHKDLIVLVASLNEEHCREIRGVLEAHRFSVVDEFPSLPPCLDSADSERLAQVVQVQPNPSAASEQIAQLKQQAPDVPILFAVDDNTASLEINVRSVGVQYYMLLPAEADELIVVVNSLARA